MSLIKGHEAQARVRGLPITPPAEDGPTALDREHAALVEQVASLEAALAQARATIGEHAAALRDAGEHGRQEGFAEGQKAAQNGQAAALERLSLGLERAERDRLAQMAAVETFAILVARSGLERVFGPASDKAALVEAIIRQQLRDLSADLLMRVEVARCDFPDASSLAKLGLAFPGLDVAAIEAFKSGDCRMALRLGGLEIGVDQQWSRLRRLIEDWIPAESWT